MDLRLGNPGQCLEEYFCTDEQSEKCTFLGLTILLLPQSWLHFAQKNIDYMEESQNRYQWRTFVDKQIPAKRRKKSKLCFYAEIHIQTTAQICIHYKRDLNIPGNTE